MSQTIKRCFYRKLTFKKMLEAHYRAKDGKSSKNEVIIFEMDLETNIIKIIDEIKNGVYKFGKYREFKVYEPKERLIKALPYRDRVVHQWYVEEFIKPYLKYIIIFLDKIISNCPSAKSESLNIFIVLNSIIGISSCLIL